jgi:hypothetical protein
MELTSRQRRFILAAFEASLKGKRSFSPRAVGATVGMDEDESNDMLGALGRRGVFLLTFGDEQEFTDAGRELARELLDSM